MNSEPRRYRKVLRDPVHGYVQIPHAVMPVVQSYPVQRLRNISQNARTIAAYPSQNGSRFEHALGTMHLASAAWEHAFANAWEQDRDNSVKSKFLSEVADFLEKKHRDPTVNDPLLDDFFTESSDHAVKERRRAALTDQLPRMISHALGIVGLLHDIGHPPFSHLLESIFMEYADDIFGPGTKDRFHQYRSKVDGYPQFHEFAGKEILDHLLNESVFAGVSAVLVEAIFAARSGKTWMSCLHSIIDGQMDVDRLDYIRRDALRAGTENHAIDQERLLESTELHIEANGQWAVGVGARALSAVETLLLQRAQSYRWVIHNSRAIVSDACLKRAFAIALERSIIHNDTAYGDRPDLDYVSSWRPDSHCVPTSYEVDDGTVRRWLRQCRRNASNSRDALSSKFLACMRVADESSTAYKPAWKTYGDFHTALSQYIGRGDELAKDLAMALRLNSDSTAGAILIEDEAIVTDTAALQFNRLIKKIAEARPDAAQDIEDDLNQSVTDVGGIPGIWVVSYISSIKAYNREKTKLWIGDTEYYLDELSPIPAALSAADLMRPIIWPFFISFDERIPKRAAVAEAFVSTVVKLHKNLLIM